MSHAHQVIFMTIALLVLCGGSILLFCIIEFDFPAPPRPARKQVSLWAKLWSFKS